MKKLSSSMKLSTSVLTGAAFALLLVGCGQQDDRDARTSDAGSSMINEDARTSQAPARDPSLPATDVYNEADSTGTTGAATGTGSTGTGTAGTGTTGTGTAGTGGTGTGATGTGTTMDGDGRISGNQDSGTDQTSPDTLTQEEERNDMPPAQTGDRSNPDQTSSR